MVKIETARKFTFDVGWVFVASLAAMAVGLVIRIILGNYFDAAGLGAYTMVLTIWSIVTLTTGAGAPGALIKYVAECPDDKDTRDSLVSASILNGLIMGLAATIIFIVASPWLESIFNIPDLGRLMSIAALSFPFVTMNNVFVSYLNAIRKMKLYAVFEIYRKGVVIVFTIIFIWIGLGIPGAVWALVVAPVSVTIIQEAYHGKLFNYTFKRYKECTKRLFTFGSQIFASNMVGMITSQAATLLIGFYMLDSDVGIFSVALVFSGALIMLPTAIQKITYPAISEYHSKQKFDSMKKMMETTMRFSFVFLAIVSLVSIFYIDDMISLIFPGKDAFMGAVDAFRIMAVIGVLYGFLTPIGAVFTSIGRADIPLKISIFNLIITMVLLFLLVPLNMVFLGFQIGGINGAALVFSVTQLLNVLINIALIKKIVPVHIDFKMMYLGSALFIGITALAYFATPYLSGNIIGAIVIPLFSIGLYFFGIINIGEFKKAVSMMRK